MKLEEDYKVGDSSDKFLYKNYQCDSKNVYHQLDEPIEDDVFSKTMGVEN